MITLAATAAAFAGGLRRFRRPPSRSRTAISEIIVYGTDPCPRSTDDEVVVCARKPEAERYRIPEKLRAGGPRQSRDAWANKARALETVGSTGIVQLLAGRARRLHRLPDPGSTRPSANAANSRAGTAPNDESGPCAAVFDS